MGGSVWNTTTLFARVDGVVRMEHEFGGVAR